MAARPDVDVDVSTPSSGDTGEAVSLSTKKSMRSTKADTRALRVDHML